MTELEKARANRFAEIDFNKLAAELSKDFESLHDIVKNNTFSTLRQTPATVLNPTVNVVLALNNFINALRIEGRDIPLVVGGILVLLETIYVQMDEQEKLVAEAIKNIIMPGVTSVNMSYLAKEGRKNGGSQV